MSRSSPIVRNELLVGTFVAIAAILAFMYLAKKSREHGLLGSRTVVFSVDHGSGLEAGAPVVMQGITVGEIDEVLMTADQRIRVAATINPHFADHIREDTKATVIEPIIPSLGTTRVDLTPGQSEKLAVEDQEIEHITKESLFGKVEEIEAKVHEVIAKVDTLVDTTNEAMTSVKEITAAIQNKEGVIGKLVYDTELADDTKQLVKDMGELIRKLNEGEFAGDLTSISADLKTIVGDIEEGKGALGKLYKDDALVTEAEGLLVDARASLKGLDDLNAEAQTSIQRVQTLLDETGGTMKKVNALLESTSDITGELAVTLKKINEGEGTIAALLNDDAIFRETKSLLKELRESVEDLREQAPINSFIGVVFAAF